MDAETFEYLFSIEEKEMSSKAAAGSSNKNENLCRGRDRAFPIILILRLICFAEKAEERMGGFSSELSLSKRWEYDFFISGLFMIFSSAKYS